MMNPEFLKKILPGIITQVAINYPVAYINSISFNVKNKIVAACFWNDKNGVAGQKNYFKIDPDGPGCFIFHSNEDIKTGEIEITCTDQSGSSFLVTLPYDLTMNYKIAS
ncbi:MAG: hypothetical protein ACHQFW_01080 [Chitinophagales bacterium]